MRNIECLIDCTVHLYNGHSSTLSLAVFFLILVLTTSTSSTTTGSINPTSTNAVPVGTCATVSNDAVDIGFGSDLVASVVFNLLLFHTVMFVSKKYN